MGLVVYLVPAQASFSCTIPGCDRPTECCVGRFIAGAHLFLGMFYCLHHGQQAQAATAERLRATRVHAGPEPPAAPTLSDTQQGPGGDVI